TPIEETLEALHDVVKAGKARYIGASSMHSWQFAKALYTADLNGWTRFATMQDHYNLLYREEEREMLPFCVDQGIGAIPWSPLARGPLGPAVVRADVALGDRRVRSHPLQRRRPADRRLVDSVIDVADKRGIAPAQVALAWLLGRAGVDAPIVGATKAHHLDDAIAAVDLRLDQSEIESLEKAYQPHAVAGFR
ncbi:MAG: aldo/keto reductase, partial [Actinomycetota bacterium]|nr:aldo/keto reductase [Actinomycetota bacterium]